MSLPPTLETVNRIGLIGDIHGDIGRFLRVARFLAQAGVRVLVGLGDAGFSWPGTNQEQELAMLTRRLESLDQAFYWIDGNHDNHTLLRSYPVGVDGTAVLSPRVVFLPRAYRTSLATGRTLAVLGGANSIDRHLRGPAEWWDEEQITVEDLQRPGGGHADILLGHDVPLDVVALDAFLALTDQQWPAAALQYAAEGRAMFHKGFLQVTPELSVGGHYHHFVDETVGYYSDGGDRDVHGFPSRVVVLDMLQHANSACVGILNTDTLELEFHTRDGAQVPTTPQVTELTPDTRGRWWVDSQGSTHLLDLDRGLVERFAGSGRPQFDFDGPRPIRTLERCRIGRPGYWTIQSDQWEKDYYWLRCSVIRHLRPAPPKPGPEATLHPDSNGAKSADNGDEDGREP